MQNGGQKDNPHSNLGFSMQESLKDDPKYVGNFFNDPYDPYFQIFRQVASFGYNIIIGNDATTFEGKLAFNSRKVTAQTADEAVKLKQLRRKVTYSPLGYLLCLVASGDFSSIHALIKGDYNRFDEYGITGNTRNVNIDERIVNECFLAAYDRSRDVALPEERVYHNAPNPEELAFVHLLQGKDVQPIEPEAMGMIFSKLIADSLKINPDLLPESKQQ